MLPDQAERLIIPDSSMDLAEEQAEVPASFQEPAGETAAVNGRVLCCVH